MATKQVLGNNIVECQIVIEGKLYDCSKWREHHPGGAIILDKYHNRDATDVFYAFHGEDGFKKLSDMKSLEFPTEVDPLSADFRSFRMKLESEGWFNSSLAWYTYKTTETIGITLLGLTLGCLGHWFIGAILMGLGYQQLGWLAHDYCHQQVFKNRKLNNFFAYLTGNILSGLSVNWWKDRHNSHHAITNVLDADPDLENLPLFSWDKHDFPTIPTRWGASTLIPHQHLYFLPWTMTLKIIWNLQSFFWNKRKQSAALQKLVTTELTCLYIHHLGVFFVCWYSMGSLSATLAFIAIAEFIGGAGIANIVFMNHYACEQVNQADSKNATFVELQLQTTRNIEPSVWMNWFSGGLNLQVEHHLFPTMPRHNLMKVRPLVQQFCKEHNLPYCSLPWSECMSGVLKKLAQLSALYREHKATVLSGGPLSPSIKLRRGNHDNTAW